MARDAKPGDTPSLEKAIRIGRENPELARALGPRSRALFAVPRDQERGESDTTDHMLVGFYDYEHERSLVAVIDTKHESVISVRETGAVFQLSDAEQQEAEHIAAADARVRSRLADRELNALTRLYFPPRSDASGRHRHAIVFLRPSKSERWYAIVDLTAKAVIDVVSRRQLAGK